MAGFLTHPFFNYFQYIVYIVLHIPLMGYTVGLLADELECFECEDRYFHSPFLLVRIVRCMFHPDISNRLTSPV
ncbi:hypothetical protein JB92DRAFT_2856891, partial [Gautieria morchelliformis]